MDRSEGMVALVRGLGNSQLAVTVVDSGKQYTLMPNQYLEKSQAKQQHPVKMSPLPGQYSDNSTSSYGRIIPKSGGAGDNMKFDSSTQATDGRYASTYKMTHCHVRPTSPPVELTEFPPQRADPKTGHGNFVVGGSGSGETEYCPAKPTAFRSALSWPDKGSVCSPRPSKHPDAFASSLRKYPSSGRSAELIERLITYNSSLKCGSRISTSPRSSVSPSRSIKETVSPNRSDCVNEPCGRLTANYGQSHRASEQEVKRKMKKEQYDWRKPNDVLEDYHLKQLNSMKFGNGASNNHKYGLDTEIQASPTKVSKEVYTVPRPQPESRASLQTKPLFQIAVYMSPLPSRTFHELQERRQQLPSQRSNSSLLQDLAIQSTVSTITLPNNKELLPRRSMSQEEIVLTKPGVHNQILSLLKDVPMVPSQDASERLLRKDVLLKLYDKLRFLAKKVDKNTSDEDFIRKLKNLISLTFDSTNRRRDCDFSGQMNDENNITYDIALKETVSNISTQVTKVDKEILKWFDQIQLAIDDKSVLQQKLEEFTVKIKQLSDYEDYDRKTGLKCEVMDFLEELPLIVDVNCCKRVYIHRLGDDLVNTLLNIKKEAVENVIVKSQSSHVINNIYEDFIPNTIQFISCFIQPSEKEIGTIVRDEFDRIINSDVDDEDLRHLIEDITDLLMDSTEAIRTNETDKVIKEIAYIILDSNTCDTIDAIELTKHILNRTIQLIFRNKEVKTFKKYTVAKSFVSRNSISETYLFSEIRRKMNNVTKIQQTLNRGTSTDFETRSVFVEANPENYSNPTVQEYKLTLRLVIEKWLSQLTLLKEEKRKQYMINSLINILVDRQNFLQIYGRVKSNEKEDRIFLNHLITKWIDKYVSGSNTMCVENINDLIEKISNIPFDKVVNDKNIEASDNQHVIGCIKEAELRQIILESLSKIPNYKERFAKDKMLLETVVTEISDKILEVVNEAKETNTKDSLIEDVTNQVVLPKEVKNSEMTNIDNNMLEEEINSHDLNELNDYETELVNKDDDSDYVVKELNLWLNSLPLKINNEENKRLSIMRNKFEIKLKTLLNKDKIDDLEIKYEAMKFLKHLPLERCLLGDKEFLNQQMNIFTDNLLLECNKQMKQETRKHKTVANDDIKNILLDWLTELPAKYNQTSHVCIFESLSLKLAKLITEPIEVFFEYNQAVLIRLLAKHFRMLPIIQDGLKEPYFKEVISEMYEYLKQRLVLKEKKTITKDLLKFNTVTPVQAMYDQKRRRTRNKSPCCQTDSRNESSNPESKPESRRASSNQDSLKIDNDNVPECCLLDHSNSSKQRNENKMEARTKPSVKGLSSTLPAPKNKPCCSRLLSCPTTSKQTTNIPSSQKKVRINLFNDENKSQCCRAVAVQQNEPMTVNQLNHALIQYVKEWCDKLPINAGEPITSDARLWLFNMILQTVMKIRSDPMALRDAFFCEDILEDEVEHLIAQVPQSQELQNKKRLMLSNLVRYISNANTMLCELVAAQSYRQELKEALSNTLPKAKYTTADDAVFQEIAKETLIDDFIQANYEGNDENAKALYHMKITDEIAVVFQEFVRLGGVEAVNAEQLKHAVYNAMYKVPKPSDEQWLELVKESVLKEEISKWYKDLPLEEYRNTEEQLFIDKNKCLLAKKLVELEKGGETLDESENREIKHEISKFLHKVNMKQDEDLNLDFMIQELVNRLKNSQKINDPDLSLVNTSRQNNYQDVGYDSFVGNTPLSSTGNQERINNSHKVNEPQNQSNISKRDNLEGVGGYGSFSDDRPLSSTMKHALEIKRPDTNQKQNKEPEYFKPFQYNPTYRNEPARSKSNSNTSFNSPVTYKENSQLANKSVMPCCKTSYPKKASDFLYEEVSQWCREIPMPNSETGPLGNLIISKVGQLNQDPEMLNDSFLYDNALEDEIDKVLENVRADADIINELKTDLLERLKPVRKLAKAEKDVHNYKKQVADTIAKVITPKKASLRQQAKINTTITSVKDDIADALVEMKFDSENQDTSKKRLIDEIDRFVDVSKKNDVTLGKSQVKDKIYDALVELPSPDKNTLVDEVEEIRVRSEITDWLKELHLTSTPEDKQNKIKSLLAKRLHALEKEVSSSSPQYIEKVKTEISRCLKKFNVTSETDKFNQMVDVLAMKLKQSEPSRRISTSPTTEQRNLTEQRMRIEFNQKTESARDSPQIPPVFTTPKRPTARPIEPPQTEENDADESTCNDDDDDVGMSCKCRQFMQKRRKLPCVPRSYMPFDGMGNCPRYYRIFCPYPYFY